MSDSRAFLTLPLVHIVVLSWNRSKTVLRCLAQLSRLDYPNFRTVVVDNCSDDNSIAMIRAHYPSIDLIENSVNQGYAGGANRGIEHALASNAEFVWLLNDDTTFDPKILSVLVAHMLADGRVVASSPLIRYEDDPMRIQFCGTYVDCVSAKVRGLKSLDDEKPRDGEFPVLVGAALLLRCDTLRKIGMFDETLFAYWEDFDLSMRLVHQGGLLAVVPQATLYHSATAAPHSTFVRPAYYHYLINRNEYFFWKRHLRGRMRRATYALSYLAAIIEEAGNYRHRGSVATANACLNAAWSAILNRRGSYQARLVMPKALRAVLAWKPSLWSALLRGRFGLLFRKLLGR